MLRATKLREGTSRSVSPWRLVQQHNRTVVSRSTLECPLPSCAPRKDQQRALVRSQDEVLAIALRIGVHQVPRSMPHSC